MLAWVSIVGKDSIQIAAYNFYLHAIQTPNIIVTYLGIVEQPACLTC